MGADVARKVLLACNFSAARGIQVLAPIVVASFLPLSIYGTIEWSHASAVLLSSAVMLGVASMIPIYLIQGSTAPPHCGNVRAACWHSVGVGILALTAAFLSAIWFGTSHAFVLMFVLAGTLAGHGFLTGYFRASGRMNVALYLEALPFGALAVLALLIRLGDPAEPMKVLSGAMSGVAVTLLLLTVRFERNWRSLSLSLSCYRETLRAGIPLMASGLVAVAATVSGRFGAGAIGGPETAGAFAALARIAALCIVVHQFIVIARWHDLYALPKENLQRIGLVVNAFVVGSCVLMFALVLVPFPLFGPAFQESFAENREAAVWLIAQVVLWSCTSVNEVFVLRCGVAARAAVLSAVSLVVALGTSAFLLNDDASVTDFARLHTLVMGSVLIAQVLGLGDSRHLFYRYWAAVAFSLLGLLMIGWAFVFR